MVKVSEIKVKLQDAMDELAIQKLISLCREDHSLHHPGLGGRREVAACIASRCKERWVNMSNREKAPFINMVSVGMVEKCLVPENILVSGDALKTKMRKKLTPQFGSVDFKYENEDILKEEMYLPPVSKDDVKTEAIDLVMCQQGEQILSCEQLIQDMEDPLGQQDTNTYLSGTKKCYVLISKVNIPLSFFPSGRVLRPYLCNVCEKGFLSDKERQYHENRHYKLKSSKCTSCDSTFTTPGELNRHVKYKHTNKKYFQCNECAYSCVENAKLQRHMRTHTGERPFQCPDCSYSAADRFKLKRHIRVHTGEKPYKCDMCNVTFSQQNSMKEHRNTHISGIPIFQCNLCSKTCKRKRDLRTHMSKFHSSEYVMICSKCDQNFSDRASLKVHQQSHRGD